MEGRCGSLTQAPAKEPPIRMAATGMAPRLASTPPEAPCQPLQSQKAPFSFEMNRLSIELPFTFLCFYRSPFAHIWSPNAPLLGCRTHPLSLQCKLFAGFPRFSLHFHYTILGAQTLVFLCFWCCVQMAAFGGQQGRNSRPVRAIIGSQQAA